MMRSVAARIRNLCRWARRSLRSVGCSWTRVTGRIGEIRRTVTWCVAARFWKVLVGVAEFYSVFHFAAVIMDHWPF